MAILISSTNGSPKEIISFLTRLTSIISICGFQLITLDIYARSSWFQLEKRCFFRPFTVIIWLFSFSFVSLFQHSSFAAISFRWFFDHYIQIMSESITVNHVTKWIHKGSYGNRNFDRWLRLLSIIWMHQCAVCSVHTGDRLHKFNTSPAPSANVVTFHSSNDETGAYKAFFHVEQLKNDKKWNVTDYGTNSNITSKFVGMS